MEKKLVLLHTPTYEKQGPIITEAFLDEVVGWYIPAQDGVRKFKLRQSGVVDSTVPATWEEIQQPRFSPGDKIIREDDTFRVDEPIYNPEEEFYYYEVTNERDGRQYTIFDREKMSIRPRSY